MTWAAVASRAAYFASGSMSLVASIAAATICGTPCMSALVEDAAQAPHVRDSGVAAEPHRVRRAAPGKGQGQLVLAGDRELVAALSAASQSRYSFCSRKCAVDIAALTRIVWVDAMVGLPPQNTAMSRVSRPGVSRQIWAAISPVVYIWAMPG